MRSFILNVNENKAGMIEVEDSLNRFYELLDCETIDIPERAVGGVWYDIVCDDEGLLKPDPFVSGLDEDTEPMLVGSLLFFHHDEDGNLTELSEEDISNLTAHLRVISEPEELKGRIVMTGLGY